MLSADAGSIPVCDGDKVIGMITDRDIAVRGVAEGPRPGHAGPRPDERRTSSARARTTMSTTSRSG